MASKQVQKTDSKSSSGVASFMDPYFKSLYGETNKAMGAVDRSLLKGPAVAGTNMWDTEAQSAAGGTYRGMSRPGGSFTKNVTDNASGMYLNPDTNPYLRGNINAATAPVLEQLTRSILPGMKSQDISMNAFGSDRGLLREGQAVGDYGEAAARISAEMIGDNYTRERAYMLDAPNQYGAAANAEMVPAQIAEAIASMVRGDQQLGIDNELMTKQINSMLPFLGLDSAANIFGATPYRTQEGTQTTTTQVKPNQASELFKLGLAGAQLMMGMPPTALAGGTSMGGGTGPTSGGSGQAGGLGNLTKMFGG